MSDCFPRASQPRCFHSRHLGGVEGSSWSSIRGFCLFWDSRVPSEPEPVSSGAGQQSQITSMWATSQSLCGKHHEFLLTLNFNHFGYRPAFCVSLSSWISPNSFLFSFLGSIFPSESTNYSHSCHSAMLHSYYHRHCVNADRIIDVFLSFSYVFLANSLYMQCCTSP